MTNIEEEEELQSQRAIREREHTTRVANRERILEQYGEDDLANGSILRFYKMFQDDGQLYTYAAVKSRGEWFVTNENTPFTWVEFWQFFELGNLLDARFIFAVTEYESLYDFDEEVDTASVPS